MLAVYGPHKLLYTIRNLTNGKEYTADVTNLLPFYFDSKRVLVYSNTTSLTPTKAVVGTVAAER